MPYAIPVAVFFKKKKSKRLLGYSNSQMRCHIITCHSAVPVWEKIIYSFGKYQISSSIFSFIKILNLDIRIKYRPRSLTLNNLLLNLLNKKQSNPIPYIVFTFR